MMRSIGRLAMTAALALAAGAAQAQSYPTKQITMVLPFAPGGPSDLIGRLVSQKLEGILGQTIVIDNRAGAGGTIAARFVASAAPDGYTLMFGTSGTLTISPALYQNLPYDSATAFSTVTQVSSAPLIMLAHPSLPVSSMKEFIAYAKANPGKLNYGSAGNGSPSHLGTVLFDRMAGVQGVHVPYRSGGEALTGILQGQLQYLADTVFTAAPHIKAGTVKVLAVASDKRSQVLPDVPTMAEVGLPDLKVGIWNGIVGPTGLPQPVIERIYAATKQVLAMPDVLETFARHDTVAIGSTPAEFAATIAAEYQVWKGIIGELGLKVN